MFLINEFNKILMKIANYPVFPNIYQTDFRGIKESQKDWYDEMILKSSVYEDVFFDLRNSN